MDEHIYNHQEINEPRLYRVTLMLCSQCVSGVGGECHTPGCALWMERGPCSPLQVEHAELAHR